MARGYLSALDDIERGEKWVSGLFDQRARLLAGRAAAGGDYAAGAGLLTGRGLFEEAKPLMDEQDRLTKRDTRKRALSAVETRDYAGGMKAAVESGDVELYNSLDAIQDEAVKTEAMYQLRAVDALSKVPLARRKADFDQYIAPDLAKLNPELAERLTAAGPDAFTDEALQMHRARLGGEIRKLMEVKAGDTTYLVDPSNPGSPVATFDAKKGKKLVQNEGVVGTYDEEAGTFTPLWQSQKTEKLNPGEELVETRPGGMIVPDTVQGVWEALESQESGGRQDAVSPKGAFGVAQLMPATAQEVANRLGRPELAAAARTDPAVNRTLGQAYLAQQLDRYDGNMTLALAAYNAGPGAVDGWLSKIGDPRNGQITDADFAQRIPYKETRNYVASIARRAGGASTAEASGAEASSGVRVIARGAAKKEAAPSGYRWNGDKLEAIPGGPADKAQTGAGRLLTAQETQALGFARGSLVYMNEKGEPVLKQAPPQEGGAEQRGRARFALPIISEAAVRMEQMERGGNPFGTLRGGAARVAEAIPFDGGFAGRVIGGDRYQAYEQASRSFEASVLPMFSGAAVTDSEAKRFVRASLPQPGDSASTLRAKARNRKIIANTAARLVNEPEPFPNAGVWPKALTQGRRNLAPRAGPARTVAATRRQSSVPVYDVNGRLVR